MSREEAERIEAMIAARPKDAPLDVRRQNFEAMAANFPVPDGLMQEEVTLGGVPAIRYAAPGADPGRVILYLHGGAFVIGSARSYREMAGRLSADSGMTVLCPDYRLSPEHVYPDALDDTVSAWNALCAAKPDCAVLAGDSCGGNLALAAAQRAVAGGGRRPEALYLISPYLDLSHSGESVKTRAARDVFVRPESMPQTARTYLGETDPRDPGASPLFGDMDGLPPVLIQVGGNEVLYDDASRLAAAIETAGGAAQLSEWPGMMHVFPFFGPWLEEGRKATRQAGAFLRAL